MEKKMIEEKIETYVEENKEEMLNLWKKIVSTESGPQQKDGVSKVIDILVNEMKKNDVETKVIPVEKAGDILVGTWNKDSENAPIIFMGHTDTVFEPGFVEEHPFTIDSQGNAYGPGVLDMKGGLVIAIYTLKALIAAGYKKHPIKFVFAGDEETLHVNSNTQDIMANEIKNSEIVINFETGYLDDGIVVGRKGGGVVSINVQGIAAHSGIHPEKGRSAILEAAHKVIELESQNDLDRGRLLNCGIIKGGSGENTISDECDIRLAIRFPSNTIKNEILQIIEDVTNKNTVEGTSASFKIEMLMDAMETTDGVLELFDHFKNTAQKIGYGDIYPFSVGGVSDAAIAVNLGIPTICGMGVKGENNHTTKEYALTESLFSRTKLVANAVYDYR